MTRTKTAAPPGRDAAENRKPEPRRSYQIARPASIDAAGAAIAAIIGGCERRTLARLWLQPSALDSLIAGGVTHPRYFTRGLNRELARLLAVAPEPLPVAVIVRILRDGGIETTFDEIAEILATPCAAEQAIARARLIRASARLRRSVAAWWAAAVRAGALDWAHTIPAAGGGGSIVFIKPRQKAVAR